MKLIDIHFIFILVGLDFWMLEIIFVVIINILLFKNKLYIHQKLAFVFILFFSSIMKIISIIFIFKDGEEKIYIKYTWIVPIGIIFFILLYLLDAYIICKMKWYFDLKFISEKKVLIFLGLMGLLIFLICSLISNFIECQENDYTSLFCTAYEDENSPKYVDNFSIFFKNIWKEDRTPFINCVYILIILLKIILSALYYFFKFFIIKVLGPEYLLCADAVLYFLTKIICFIYFIITDALKANFVFEFFAQLFSVLGTFIYLELVELNFCNLNYNLKRNINIRSKIEALDINKIETDHQSDDNNNSD